MTFIFGLSEGCKDVCKSSASLDFIMHILNVTFTVYLKFCDFLRKGVTFDEKFKSAIKNLFKGQEVGHLEVTDLIWL